MTFQFTPENMKEAKAIIAKYPKGRQLSALIPLLDLAQRQNGNWLSEEAMNYAADMLQVPRIRAYEAATFYTMFNLKPVGKHLLQVCTSIPCGMCGAAQVLKTCKDRLGINAGETTKDGLFSIVEVECLGACIHAPVVAINDDYNEKLSSKKMTAIIDKLEKEC
ncbi:MAG: NADH-quinone oxidoreductase subunit NuoE [Alphaproteobacteria bacterium]|nr:NADH-quinone oxidoreductase subunit NuoE [Alphaproteobacteria bacterium]MCL2505043.1 NADH-quinone oxidoreductase subunit NuoE [Alphaproteobacteria bacterium]